MKLDVNENILQTGGVLAIIHTIGHIINFYTLSRQPMEVLSCLLPSTFRKNGRDDQPSFSFFIFQTLQGITGTVKSESKLKILLQKTPSRRWKFQLETIPWLISKGVMIIIVMSVIYVFASQRSRRRQHRLFWTTHMLYPLFFFLLCIHGLQVRLEMLEMLLHHFYLLHFREFCKLHDSIMSLVYQVNVKSFKNTTRINKINIL